MACAARVAPGELSHAGFVALVVANLARASPRSVASATMMIKNEANIEKPDPDHCRPARRVRLEIKEVGSPKGRDPVTRVKGEG